MSKTNQLQIEDLPADETARSYVIVSKGLAKAWDAKKIDRTSDELRELVAVKTELDSLIRTRKMKLKELEQEINA